MHFDWKKIFPHLFAILVFFAIAVIYMSPALEGKVIAGGDGVSWQGMVHEAQVYHEETGEYTWWTGSMFSGMPNYQIGGGRNVVSDWLWPITRFTNWGNRAAIPKLVTYLVCFFILLLSVRVNKWLALAGAIAMSFSTYFLIIIGASHVTKVVTLSLMPSVIAGLYLVFNGHRKTGVLLTMIGTMAGFYPHPQMSYYLMFIVGFFFLAELWKAATSKAWRAFGISTAIFAAAFLVGFGTGTASTFSNLEYSNETMRGGHSDLVKESDSENKTSGLDLDYATAWSYGIDETWTLLVPDYMGGSSGYAVGKDSRLYDAMVKKGVPRRSAEQFCRSVPTYWGDQPFTAGPVYVGAIVCFLFVLGLCIVKGPYKWALLGATILSVMLAWGHNMMWLTRLFFDLVPMYSKFRAVSSILVIAEITIPLLGFLALKQIVDGDIDRKKVIRAIGISAGITGGLCLLLALVGPAILDFTSPLDNRYFGGDNGWLIPLMQEQRRAMMVGDAWRSLLFIALATALVMFYVRSEKLKTPWFALSLAVLILLDMWPVNKRYMNDSMFSKPASVADNFKMTDYERGILEDKDPHFRVLNLATNTFNEARTSYYLKSIGGYHAAKLRRYQDLIDEHLSQMHWPVINMLNAKYIIYRESDGQASYQLNPGAMGNAWFVDALHIVDNANEESDALMQIDLHHEAVLDKAFADHVTDLHPTLDSTAVVRLTKYTPEYIEYDTENNHAGTIVFSEIYYPYGWKALVDGESADIYRVNYMLRALNVPSGKHHIRLEFRPESVERGGRIALTFVVIMYLVIAAILALGVVGLVQRHRIRKQVA